MPCTVLYYSVSPSIGTTLGTETGLLIKRERGGASGITRSDRLQRPKIRSFNSSPILPSILVVFIFYTMYYCGSFGVHSCRKSRSTFRRRRGERAVNLQNRTDYGSFRSLRSSPLHDTMAAVDDAAVDTAAAAETPDDGAATTDASVAPGTKKTYGP